VIVRDLAWASDDGSERIRIPRFTRRVPVPIESIVAVANAMTQRLSEMLQTPIELDFFPPVMLECGVWEALCENAFVYEITGERADATLLCPKSAAGKILQQAFGEDVQPSLSPFELRVLDRFVAHAATALTEICGARVEYAPAARSRHREIYCELRIRSPFVASLAVATNEPAAQIGVAFSARALDDCPIECSARLGVGAADIFTIASLSVGDILPLEAKVGPSATLNLGPNVIAAGEGGVLGDRTAFKIHELV
jgi:flagellar motor switch/type III secretory pathway protein FliN